MTYKQYIRDVKLNDLGIEELSGKSLEIYKFLKENLTGLNEYTSNEYPNYILYGKNKNNIVLEYNIKHKDLYVHYKNVWLFFSDELSMKFKDIELLIQEWVVDTLKIEVNYII